METVSHKAYMSQDEETQRGHCIVAVPLCYFPSEISRDLKKSDRLTGNLITCFGKEILEVKFARDGTYDMNCNSARLSSRLFIVL